MSRTITQRVVDNARKQGVTILERHEWGARYEDVYKWRRAYRPAKQPADTLVGHISVTLDHGPLTGHFKTDMQTIERIGYQRFRTGFSYNMAFDMTTGMVGVGQPLDAKGSHTINDKNVPNYSKDQNYHARAFVVIGMPGYKLRWRARRSLVKMATAMVEEGALTEGFDLDPHSKFAYKDCPCDPFRNFMPRMRRRVRRRVRRRALARKLLRR